MADRQIQMREIGRSLIAGTLVCALAISPTMLAAQQQQPVDMSQITTIKVKTEIVLTNVVVRDKKTGQVVKGLKAQRLYDP